MSIPSALNETLEDWKNDCFSQRWAGGDCQPLRTPLAHWLGNTAMTQAEGSPNAKNIIPGKQGNPAIISTQKLVMNRHVIYSFIKRRQTSNQRGSRLAILLMTLPHFWVKRGLCRWNAESGNILPTQEATLPALIKENQQLPLAVGDDGNKSEKLNYRLARQAGLSLAGLTRPGEPQEFIWKIVS